MLEQIQNVSVAAENITSTSSTLLQLTWSWLYHDYAAADELWLWTGKMADASTCSNNNLVVHVLVTGTAKRVLLVTQHNCIYFIIVAHLVIIIVCIQ